MYGTSSQTSRQFSSYLKLKLNFFYLIGPQIITISVMSVLFLMSAALNLHVLSNLMAARRSVGLSRLNTLLLQLVLADLLVRD